MNQKDVIQLPLLKWIAITIDLSSIQKAVMLELLVFQTAYGPFTEDQVMYLHSKLDRDQWESLKMRLNTDNGKLYIDFDNFNVLPDPEPGPILVTEPEQPRKKSRSEINRENARKRWDKVKAEKAKLLGKHSFEQSPYYDFEAFKKEMLQDSRYSICNLVHYYDRLKNYQGKQYKDWTKTAKTFILNDAKEGKVVLNTAGKQQFKQVKENDRATKQQEWYSRSS